MKKFEIPNVLADRYASPSMVSLWSPTGKVIMEREFWIAVMKAQKDLGIKIEKQAIDQSEKVKGLVDLEKYVTKNSNDMKVLTKDFFRQLRIPMQKQLQDLRSSIVREACKAITSIAINGNSNGCIVIDFCLPNNSILSNSVKFLGNNKYVNKFFTKIADRGIEI